MIYFLNTDFKYKAWALSLKQLGFSVEANNKSYPYNILYVIGLYVKRVRVDSIVFRYLNDRTTLLRTLLNLLTDIIVVLVSKMKNVKIFWIAHNVDRESKIRYGKISSIRRYLINKYSDKIFVTDPLLIKYTYKHGIATNKLDWISFGVPDNSKPKVINKKNEELVAIVRNYKASLHNSLLNKKVFLGICVTSPMAKFYHFLFANKLVQQNSSNNYQLALVLIGRFPEGDKFDEAKQKVKENEFILHIDENFPVHEKLLENEIDFFYRTVNDISVSYSVYVAASLGKPILTDNYGFLSEMVTAYNLGMVIPIDENKKVDLIANFILTWDSSYSEEFLKNHSWKIGAERIISAL